MATTVGTLVISYDSSIDSLSSNIIILDDNNQAITNMYSNNPANLGESFTQNNSFYYFTNNNMPSRAIITGYNAIWSGQHDYLASNLALFFNDSIGFLPNLSTIQSLKNAIFNSLPSSPNF